MHLTQKRTLKVQNEYASVFSGSGVQMYMDKLTFPVDKSNLEKQIRIQIDHKHRLLEKSNKQSFWKYC